MTNLMYHVSPTLLGVGSTIQKGNWGRIIKKYTDKNANSILFREYILEMVRAEHHPHKPSRLDCIFLLPDIQSAWRYKQLMADWNVIYEVEIDPTLTTHSGDYQKVIPMNEPLLHQTPNFAHNYWTVDPNPSFIEILYPSSVTITKIIEDSL